MYLYVESMLYDLSLLVVEAQQQRSEQHAHVCSVQQTSLLQLHLHS